METGISIRRCTEPDLRGSIGSVRCLTGRLEIFAFPDVSSRECRREDVSKIRAAAEEVDIESVHLEARNL
ncbi:hypothetical protein BC628DRAFT_1356785 [Trametes gibbosa]|nr:hypothetical protein BC628DRAFT_1356785 [Trametes gibbosa]